jgi:hypothetical protein
MTTDVVGFTDFTFVDHFVKSASMIFHKQPISDLHTIAIHRQRLAIEGI